MPRKADLLFLKLAVKNRLLKEDAARDIMDTLEELEAKGKGTKARYICVERNLIDEKTAKQLKMMVKSYLERQAEEATDKQIGNYAIEGKLGAGAMGMVYRAKHVKLGRKVALKLLRPEYAQDDRFIERFEREARAAAALNHPNIVQCFDAGSENDVVYIAMEFVDGKTVKELIEEKGRLSESEAVRITIQVARALEHATEHGLIHRDVKPANIMITRDGTAKLLDLGLAKKLEREDESNLTEAGRALGTPYYMAPEQALDENIDHRADIYALGATLYCMLTGEPPYKAATPTGVMARHMNDPIPSVRAKVPGVSPGLDKIVEKMLAKKPEARFQKHENLIKDLENADSGLMPELNSESAEVMPPMRMTPSQARLTTRSRAGTKMPDYASGSNPSLSSGSQQKAIAAILVVGLLIGGYLAFGKKLISGGLSAAEVQTELGLAPDELEQLAEKKLLVPGKDGYYTRKDVDAYKKRKPDKPNTGTGTETGTGTNTPDPDADNPLELAARRQYENARTSGKKGWELHDLIDNVARSRGGTKAAIEARKEADSLAKQFEQEEIKELRAASKELEAKFDSGKVLEAAEGYLALTERFRGEASLKEAKERVKAIELHAQELVVGADTKAAREAAEGREDLAAKTIRDSLPLRRGSSKQSAADRANELEKLYVAKLDKATKDKQDADLAVVKELQGSLRKLVRERQFDAARSLAASKLQGLTAQAAVSKVQGHRNNMDALVEIDALSWKAFQRLKGQPVRLETRAGAIVAGTVRDAQVSQVVVEIAKNAEKPVLYADCEDSSLLAAIKKTKVATEAKVATLVAISKVYRGEDDAAQAAERSGDPLLVALAQDMGVDPTLVARKDPVKPVKPEVAPKDPKGGTPQDPNPPKDPGGTPASNRDPSTPSGRDQIYYETAEKLFPGCSDSYYTKNGPYVNYFFTTAGKTLNGCWKLEQGDVIPSGTNKEQYGLKLGSGEGRALFDVPLQGNVKVRVRFYNNSAFRDGSSRLAITFDDLKKRDRYDCNFGRIVHEGKGHKTRVSDTPDGLCERLPSGGQSAHALELSYEDGTVQSRLNEEIVGTLSGVGMAECKLGFEWDRVNVSLVQIDITCTPSMEYVKKLFPGVFKK